MLEGIFGITGAFKLDETETLRKQVNSQMNFGMGAGRTCHYTAVHDTAVAVEEF